MSGWAFKIRKKTIEPTTKKSKPVGSGNYDVLLQLVVFTIETTVTVENASLPYRQSFSLVETN